MTKHSPVLKIYADEQASYLALKGMERSAKIGGVITLLFVIALVYFVHKEMEGIRFAVLLLCIISAAMTWMSYKSIPSYAKEYQELPLLYSFYPHGFISHRGEQEYSWEHISKLEYSKTGVNLKMARNPHNTAELSFICVSEDSLERILCHFKTHAPERLSAKLKI